MSPSGASPIGSSSAGPPVSRLATSASPYLRSHAGNPVDWWPWSDEAFAEARRRDVPVLVSIGYSSCHWCHVMARESFSDPVLAARLNEGFVAVKVDREEHPEVDAAYLAAAGAFTPNLGWPLNVFVTPEGKAFFAGTYSPPEPVAGHPSFTQVLEAVRSAWTERRAAVEDTAGQLAAALSGAAAELRAGAAADAALPGPAELSSAVEVLEAREDRVHGGFGGAPKFPVAPVLRLLVSLGSGGLPPEQRGLSARASALAHRTLLALADSDLRDRVDGGFFRYATRADWTEPHYERMLYDNALLLQAYAGGIPDARAGVDRDTLVSVAEGIASFLLSVLRQPGGAFGSAQDSESLVDGRSSDGGYFALTAEARAAQPPPAVDAKVLAGWNGLAIEALATAARILNRPDWLTAAVAAADHVLAVHREPSGRLRRVSLDGVATEAAATLEDYGMLAGGLLAITLSGGALRFALAARELVDACLDAGAASAAGPVWAVPGGGDPLLAAQGLAVEVDPSEGAYPSGTSALAAAARVLHLLSGEQRYRRAAERALVPLAVSALRQPLAFGATLELLSQLAAPVSQLVAVGPLDGELAVEAGRVQRCGTVVALASETDARRLAEAGFELFAGRTAGPAGAAAYWCEDFVCRLPVTEVSELRAVLSA